MYSISLTPADWMTIFFRIHKCDLSLTFRTLCISKIDFVVGRNPKHLKKWLTYSIARLEGEKILIYSCFDESKFPALFSVRKIFLKKERVVSLILCLYWFSTDIWSRGFCLTVYKLCFVLSELVIVTRSKYWHFYPIFIECLVHLNSRNC